MTALLAAVDAMQMQRLHRDNLRETLKRTPLDSLRFGSTLDLANEANQALEDAITRVILAASEVLSDEDKAEAKRAQDERLTAMAEQNRKDALQ